MPTDERLTFRVRSSSRVIAALATVLTSAGLTVAPCAAASPTESLRAAVAAARGGAACGSLRSDPTIDRVAEKINETTDGWLDHATRAVPETNALPVLKDFGYDATKAAMLSSTTPDVGTAVKALVLQGWAKIPDCSYTAYGVATTYNAKKEDFVMTAVLAG